MNKVAAVVVTYNRIDLLKQCVEALLKQKYPCDILLANNNSTDGTEEWALELLNKFENIKYHNTGANLGGAGGFNYGMRWAVKAGDEVVWVMNLSGIPTDASARYRINHYDPKYAQSLKDDKTFNIIAQMVIPKQECLEYVKNELHRSYKDKFCRDIVLKVDIA